MIGITAVSGYIPNAYVDSPELVRQFGVQPAFLDKIGIQRLSRKAPDESASDLCVKAFAALCEEHADAPGLQNPLEDIDFLCVCTQNGDYTLPQTSAVVHAKLGLSPRVATFDLGLGCAGYVYALSVARHFMEANDLTRGLLFTADPYSDILDERDKNTSLLFGDAAAVTLLTDIPRWHIGKGAFDTYGDKHHTLIKRTGQHLYMDGREIFNFIIRCVPGNVRRCLQDNGVPEEDVDLYIFHQANKYVIGSLVKNMGLPREKVPFDIREYGNTVSSSIPLILRDHMDAPESQHAETMLLSGFGVGLQAASIVLTKAPLSPKF
ncbi:ketoacyl-ACP synthase III [Megalodesulfovibrio paquesii]